MPIKNRKVFPLPQIECALCNKTIKEGEDRYNIDPSAPFGELVCEDCYSENNLEGTDFMGAI